MKLYQANNDQKYPVRLARQMGDDAALGGAFGAAFGMMMGGFMTIGAGRSLEHLLIVIGVTAGCSLATALLGLFEGPLDSDEADLPANPTTCGKVRPAAMTPPAFASVESFSRRPNLSAAENLRTSA